MSDLYLDCDFEEESKKHKRSHGYHMVLNNYTVLEHQLFMHYVEGALQAERIDYAICGQEVGEQGTPHLQAYIHYKCANAWTMATWWQRLGTNRWKIIVARGSALSNQKYCSKDGHYREWGVCPKDSKERKKEIVDAIKQGAQPFDIVDDSNLHLYRVMKELSADAMLDRSLNEKTDLYWFYGRPGSGKSKYARAIDPNYYPKPEGQWWTSDYVQQKVVLMDDWRPTKDFPLQELLRLADYGKMNVPVKAGYRKFRSKVIIITTPLSLESTFQQQHLEWIGTENIQQLKRRITYQCQFPLNALDAEMLKSSLEKSLMDIVPSVGLEINSQN